MHSTAATINLNMINFNSNHNKFRWFCLDFKLSCCKGAQQSLSNSHSNIQLTNLQAADLARAYFKQLWNHVRPKYLNDTKGVTSTDLALIAKRILVLVIVHLAYLPPLNRSL